MASSTQTRRRVLKAALATTALAAPFVRAARAVETAPKGKMVVGWHKVVLTLHTRNPHLKSATLLG